MLTTPSAKPGGPLALRSEAPATTHSSKFLFAITAWASPIPKKSSILSLPPKTLARALVWASVFAMVLSANMAEKSSVTTTWTLKEQPSSSASRWQPRRHPLEPLQEQECNQNDLVRNAAWN